MKKTMAVTLASVVLILGSHAGMIGQIDWSVMHGDSISDPYRLRVKPHSHVLLPPHLRFRDSDGFPTQPYGPVSHTGGVPSTARHAHSIPSTTDNIMGPGDLTPVWAKHYATPARSSWDRSSAVGVDRWGNIYMTGSVESTYTYVDFMTIKYDPSGNLIWRARYNGPANEWDYPVDIAVDSNGNVYVTGYSWGIKTSLDYATVKYDSSGVEQWVARYDGGRGLDWVADLEIDPRGNVYITGYSPGTGTGDDYATVKYNSDGMEQWVARYAGPPRSNIGPKRIAIDREGNVFIIGRSTGGHPPSLDFATIKYDSMGIEQWVRRYDGPPNWDDFVEGIGVDSLGNVYVTGSSYGTQYKLGFATIKYDSDGNEQWVVRHDYPDHSWAVALAVTGSGDVRIGGVTKSGFEMLALDSHGSTRWIRFAGPKTWNGWVRGIRIDAAGNSVMVASQGDHTGILTTWVGSEGLPMWSHVYRGIADRSNAAGVAVGPDNSVVVLGYTGPPGQSDFATLKYSQTGVLQWARTYDSYGLQGDFPTKIVHDRSGNVYVGGIAGGSVANPNWDYLVMKYDPAGNQLWATRHGVSASSHDELNAMTVDADGNVYATGLTGVYPQYDYLTTKFSPSGELLWQRTYNGPGNTSDHAWAIVTDSQQNVYVSGNSGGDYVTIKYNSFGVQQWLARHAGAGSNTVMIGLDESGDLYVVGSADGDYLIIKYNSAGRRRWIARYDGLQGDDYATRFALDPEGDLYVSGYSWGGSTHNDYLTVKYNSSGILQWAARYDGTSSNTDYPTALAVDRYGNVYVSGKSYDTSHVNECATVMYDRDGHQLWVARHNGLPVGIAVDPFGLVWVSGTTIEGSYHVRAVVYDQSGNMIATAGYRGPGYWDGANAMTMDVAGNVYVAAASKGPNWSVITTLRYDRIPVSGTTIRFPVRDRWNLISIPLIPTDLSKETLFPTATSNAFAYQGALVAQETLSVGKGYWLRFSGDHGTPVTGSTFTSDTVEVEQGWNLIGSISLPVPVSSISSIPGGVVTSNFFTHRGSYVVSDMIMPGSGHWVKVNQTAKLVLSSQPGGEIANLIKIVPMPDRPPSPPTEPPEDSPSSIVPTEFALFQNHPNPFNPVTKIRYALRDEGHVKLIIYDILGREIQILVNEYQTAGFRTTSFDAGSLPSGVYLYRLTAGTFSDVKKLVLAR